MGQHATAIMFYGYNLNHDDGDKPWPQDAEDGDDAIEIATGVADEPYEVRKAARESIGVEFELHCSYDYPCYVLAVSGSILKSYQGDATRITPEAKPEWRAVLDTAVAKIGLDISKCGEPGWFICSVYG